MKDNIKGKLFRYTGIIVVLIIWEVLPRVGLVNSDYLPSFSRVVCELFSLSDNNYLYMNVMVSVWRVMIGLIISISISVVLGLLLGYFCRKFSEKLIPLLRIYGQINPYSLFPLFVVFLGVGEPAKIGIVIWTSIWPIMLYTISASKKIDPTLIKTANSMSASKIELFFKVIVPATLPHIFSGIKVGVQMGFLILTSSEMTGSTSGLGYIIHTSGMNFLIPRLYAAGLCIIVISVLLNLFLESLQRKLLFWKEEVKLFDDIITRKVNKINKTQVICTILVFTFLLVQGTIQVKKAKDYQNNPKNGFGYVE